MRKLAVTLALASTALATPALARDGAWYVGLDGGAMIVEDITYDIGIVKDAGTVDHKYGGDFDANIGYDFGGFRVEAEVAYKQANIDQYTSTITTPYISAAGTRLNAPAGRYNYAGGRTSALSFMVNGMVDFGDDSADAPGVSGFIGAGIGVARIKADDNALNTRGAFLDDSDTVLAYQGFAGVRAPITDNLDAVVKYRFFDAHNADFIDISGRQVEANFRSHSLLGGISYNFGEPAAPPPPPAPPVEAAPPPPPPPPPAPVCSPGPFIVFFEWDKSTITAEASSILDNAVAQYQTCGNAQVMLAGHADRSGTPAYNVGLSQRRADAVSAYLSGRGIPGGVITTRAFGETAPRVETADGVRELQNRRVEITYGPGSGM
ncbi:MAG TPA: OmpA family protein [Sphingomicrobium sp.]